LYRGPTTGPVIIAQRDENSHHEDDARTANAVRTGLREGYDVAVVRTGEEGLSQLHSSSFDLVLVDWMLPGHDGIAIVKELRARGTKTPVLLLTARDAVEDRVIGLTAERMITL
jgi:DNA-binding response OmpR family regulator